MQRRAKGDRPACPPLGPAPSLAGCWAGRTGPGDARPGGVRRDSRVVCRRRIVEIAPSCPYLSADRAAASRTPQVEGNQGVRPPCDGERRETGSREERTPRLAVSFPYVSPNAKPWILHRRGRATRAVRMRMMPLPKRSRGRAGLLLGWAWRPAAGQADYGGHVSDDSRSRPVGGGALRQRPLSAAGEGGWRATTCP